MNVGRAITSALQEQRQRDVYRIADELRARAVRVVHVVAVEWHQVGDVRPGEWCWSCSLPSAVEADYVLVAVRTLRPLRRATVVVCRDCGRTETT